jgi:hypothetical protein
MGARSSPEGYRVAAGRYGLPVRKRARVTTVKRATRFAVAGVLVVATAAGCSKVTGGAKPTASGKPVTCTIIAKLDDIANTVAEADVHDPATFDATLQTAVNDYVSNVRRLRAIAPTDLSPSLQRVEADVQQLRFDAAGADRAPLDAYAARTCGRVASAATTTSIPATATTSVPSGSSAPTTARAGPTSTTAPSDG